MISRFILFVIESLGSLPLGLRRWIGRILGRVYASIETREKKIAVLQIQRFLPEIDSQKTTQCMFQHLGQTLFETINLDPILKDVDSHITCSDNSLLAELCTLNKPTIALTGHLGNWDLLGAYAVKKGLTLCTVGKQARSEHLHEVLVHLRKRYGVQTIWRGGTSGTKQILEELNKNRVIAALIDQDTLVDSLRVPFFDLPARCPSALVDLALRKSVQIVTAFLYQIEDMSYTVELAKIDSRLNTSEVLQEYNQRLEKLIRRYPSQWVWNHKRWRGTFDDTRMSTTEYLTFLENRTNEL